MVLSDNFENPSNATVNRSDQTPSNWSVLYCSHLWASSSLRRAVLNGDHSDDKLIKYCYTCKGKIRKYEVKSPRDFIPNNHSTPNHKITVARSVEATNEIYIDSSTNASTHESYVTPSYPINSEPSNVELNQCIPSISRQIDSSFRQKYSAYEMRPNEINRRRLRKSLKGIGCIVNLAVPDSPVKKSTQIQACSISVMIVAIVVISFVLVNFATPSFTRASNVVSTITVPTSGLEYNVTAASVTYLNTVTMFRSEKESLTVENITPTESVMEISTKTTSLISNIITKIRKNIRTYSRDSKKNQESLKPKEIFNRDLSPKFCSCQTDEVCMLDENNGTAMCRHAIDIEDPTGCGGLCAMETEACQLVDKTRGVRVCRLLTVVTCSAHEWRCRNGLCVPAEARCDGSIQCYDRSDEIHCECDLTKQFRCGHSISCFPNTKLCDGLIDCWDGLDELNCTAKCPENQFTCTDGQCIPPSRFCDGLADCADGSDEPRGCGGACGAHELRCRNHRCVPRTLLCDGHDNCGDSTDELNCP